MASKQNKEMKAFRAAEKVRDDLLTSLQNCTTETRLHTILNKYEENRKNHKFTVNLGNLKASHRAIIISLDEEIKELIKEKTLQFAPKEESDVSEVSEVSEETGIVGGVSELISKGTDPVLTSTHVPAQISVTNEDSQEPGLVVNPEPKILDLEFPVIPREINPERVRDLARVKIQLDALLDKKAEFIGKYATHAEKYPGDISKLEEFDKAIQATESIHDRINHLYNEYIYGDIDLDLFKRDAAPLLNDTVEDVQTLKSHRGLKEIVINLLAAIFSAGLIHVVAALTTGKFEFRLFKPATKSGVIVDNLEEAIENSHVAAASA